MLGFRRNRERDLTAELQEPRSDAGEDLTDAEITESRFSDADYDRIFETLTIEDLHLKSAEELAALAALTLAAAEDDVNMLGAAEDFSPEIAADYARASALGSFALLKQTGVSFNVQP